MLLAKCKTCEEKKFFLRAGKIVDPETGEALSTPYEELSPVFELEKDLRRVFKDIRKVDTYFTFMQRNVVNLDLEGSKDVSELADAPLTKFIERVLQPLDSTLAAYPWAEAKSISVPPAGVAKVLARLMDIDMSDPSLDGLGRSSFGKLRIRSANVLMVEYDIGLYGGQDHLTLELFASEETRKIFENDTTMHEGRFEKVRFDSFRLPHGVNAVSVAALLQSVGGSSLELELRIPGKLAFRDITESEFQNSQFGNSLLSKRQLDALSKDVVLKHRFEF